MRAASPQDMESTIAAKTAQLASLQQNNEGLHSICEEYHLELEQLRNRAAVEKHTEEELGKLKEEVLTLREQARTWYAQTSRRAASSASTTFHIR